MRWAHDKYDLGKNYKDVENKNKRPIIAFVVDQKILGKRIVYIEMSSHPEPLTPNMSIKVREWTQGGVKKESWVLVNRFGILRTNHFLHLQKHNHNVDSEYRKQII
ncbi:MAG: hypothetical protein LBG49_00240, partial [Mycoplasmataceae bacterium]|nr:hypothetical protein [Mycoplasmataceae bacterium]